MRPPDHDKLWRQKRIDAGLCCACSNPVEPHRRGRQWCVACHQRSLERVRARRQARREARLAETRSCKNPECPVVFHPTNGRHKYCTQACYQRARRVTTYYPGKHRKVRDLPAAEIDRLINARYAEIQAARRRQGVSA